jgi:hypothetical protein
MYTGVNMRLSLCAAESLRMVGLRVTGSEIGRVMEWMPPSLTASPCAKLGVLQPKKMEGGIHEGR